MKETFEFLIHDTENKEISFTLSEEQAKYLLYILKLTFEIKDTRYPAAWARDTDLKPPYLIKSPKKV
jgi:hypothetical protein